MSFFNSRKNDYLRNLIFTIMEVPKFLLRKKYLLESVFFVALFSFLFMLLYQPFSATVWFGFSSLSKALTTLSFYLTAIAGLLISKILLYRIFAVRSLTLPLYLGWIGGEYLLVALLYILFSNAFEGGPAMTPMWIVRVFFCVSLILAIPYVMIWLYSAYRVKNEELNLMKLNRTTHEEPEGSKLLHLYDNNGVQKMAIDEETLYYVESQDNYVRIYYELEGKLVSYMLRCKTQNLEEMLSATSLVRCHRSHIVNTKKIKLYRKEHDHATIFLSHPSAKPIPVSKSYFRAITELVEQRQPTTEA